MSPFTVTVGSVHGPLEVVLELVEKRKLFVNDVSLSTIADEYVAFVQESATISLADRASFIAVASALLLLKARSLLPSFTFTHDEEMQVSGFRRDLERYAFFRSVARTLATRWEHAHMLAFKREMRKWIPHHMTSHSVFAPGEWLTKERLQFAMQSLVSSLPPALPQLRTTTVRSIKSIEQVVSELVARVARVSRASFADATKGAPKEEVVVYFLALLELVKRGVVDAEQNEKDGIMLSKVSHGVMHIH